MNSIELSPVNIKSIAPSAGDLHLPDIISTPYPYNGLLYHLNPEKTFTHFTFFRLMRPFELDLKSLKVK